MDFHRSFHGLQISPMNISDTNVIKIDEQCYSPLNWIQLPQVEEDYVMKNMAFKRKA